MKFFLVTTNHLTERLLFKDDEDFRTAMNCVAIAAFLLKVNVLAFVLMSNHVHFVLQCPEEKAFAFVHKFKQLYGRHINRKYQSISYLRRLRVDVRELQAENESLHKGIAYVQMNPVAANITPSAVQYPWGSGALYFNMCESRGTEIGSLSQRKQEDFLHSKVVLPVNWRLGTEGYILPESYVVVRFVEKLFRSPKRYSFFLNNSSKSKMHLEKDAAPSFRDQVVLAAIPDLCRSLYRKDNMSLLTAEQTTDCVRQLKRRFSMDVNQLARVTGIPSPDLARLLEAL